MRYIRLRV